MAENSKLYIDIDKASPRYRYFMYFDKEPYLADQLFIKREIRVWYDEEYKRSDSPYNAIMCHVKKKDVPAFLDALEELKKSMLICGQVDYEKDVRGFIDKIYAAGK